MKLLTYNVHAALGLDGRRDLGRIARVIDAARPTVVALQEVASGGVPGLAKGRPQARWLAEQLEMELVHAPTLIRNGGPFGNAILSRVPIAESEVHWLPRLREPRNAIELGLRTPLGALRVLATHFDVDRKTQEQQVRALAALAARRKGDLVVLGDLNAFYRPSTLGPLLAGFGLVSRLRTYPAQLPLLPLDRALLRSSRLRGELRVLDGGEARVASDHLPLSIELRAAH